MIMRAKNEKFEYYLNKVQSLLPENYAQDVIEEGIADLVRGYIFTQWMNHDPEEKCALRLKVRLAIWEEDNG